MSPIAGPSAKSWSGALLLLCVLVLPYMFFAAFSGFQPYDDEGTLMFGFRDILEGRVLYRDMFALYGPAYYLALAPLFSSFHIPLTNDSARIITLVFWLSCSAAFASFSFRLTASRLAATFSMLTALFLLKQFMHSPMHPEELCFLLVACLLHLVNRAEHRPTALVLSLAGAALGALLLIKMNLGLMVAVPLALAALRATRKSALVRIGSSMALIAGLAMPVALMSSMLHIPWVVQLFFISTFTILAALAAWHEVSVPQVLEPRHWGYVLAGFAAITVATIALVLAGGAGAYEILDATVLQPALFSKTWHVAPQFRDWALLSSAAGLGSSLLYLAFCRISRFRRLAHGAVICLKTLVSVAGITLIVLAAQFAIAWQVLPSLMFHLVLPFAWLLVVPPSFAAQADPVSRVFLGLLAAFLALYAYPVAGTQFMLASLVPAVMLPVLLNDVWCDLRVVYGPRLESILRVGWLRAAQGAAYSMIAAMLIVQTVKSAQYYRSLEPLALPGATLIRAKADAVSDYHWAVAALSDCQAFYTFPGMLSFYFWTAQNPPTGLNTGSMLNRFPEAMQDRVVDDLAKHEDLCILVSPKLARFWDRGQIATRPPILRYIEDNFVETSAKGSFQLLRRRGRNKDD